MLVKCRWCKLINGIWRCTHPTNGMNASEFCSWSDRDDAIQVGHDYCMDYEPEGYEPEYEDGEKWEW